MRRVPDLAGQKAQLTAVQTKEYQCRIVQKGDQFFWERRKNRELIPIESGAFTYFLSVEGVGYIKIIDRDSKDMFGGLEYVEHLPMLLGSVNCWGKAVINRLE